MEPITTGLATSLGKLGAGVASGALKNLLRKRLLRWRVSSAAARKAKEARIQVSALAIRSWLGRDDVRNQLCAGTTKSIETAIENLAWRLGGSEDTRQANAITLLKLVLDEYLRCQSQHDAHVLANGWTQAKIDSDGERTRTALNDQTGVILEVLAGPDVFDDDLAYLHPWRRKEAAQIALVWPTFRRFVHILFSGDSPGAVLAQWSSHQPEGFETAPPQAWCWFGLMASDFGAHEASHIFISRGIELGAAPSNYWWARTALNFTGDPGTYDLAREYLGRSSTLHPLGVALTLFLDADYPAAEEELQKWHPNLPNDVVLRKLLISSCAAGQDDFNRAIAVAVEACSANPEASGPMLRAADMLLSRGLHGTSDNPLADFAQAQSLALNARDARRKWRGDSVAAILVAIKASVLGHETDQAWRYAQGSPDGAATAAEVTDPRLRREMAMLAACTNNNRLASDIAAEINEPYLSAWVSAFAAQSEGNPKLAESEWLKAWESATDDFDRLQAANALAPIGGSMPDLSDLADRHPKAVERINTVHKVMSTPGDRITLLRARAHEAEILTVFLAEQLSAAGQHSDAAEALSAGARRWNSPLLEKMAAGKFMQAGDEARAITATHSALTMAGPNWEHELDVLRIRHDALEAQGTYDEALRTLRRMIMIVPDNLSVRWALVHSLIRSGDGDGAWSALTGPGEPIQPRDLQDARAWISLASTHDRSSHLIRRSLEIMRRFPEDADFLGAVLAQLSQLHLGLSAQEGDVSAADLQALQAATASYFDANPDSSIFRAIRVGPDDNPLEALEQELRGRRGRKELSELEQQIRSGVMPLGVATEVTGRSYAEFSIQRGSVFVYSHGPAQAESSRAAIESALGSVVAIDTTAAVSLSSLDAELRDQLTGAFASLESTDTAFRDAQRAQQTLNLRSTMSVNWSEEEQRVVPAVISEEAAEAAAESANRTVQILQACTRRNWSGPRHFKDLQMEGAWLSVLDHAVGSQTPLWSDDLVLRLLAAEKGLATFGTVDLVRELVRINRLSPELGQVAEAMLLANFHVDLGFKPEIMRLAADLTGWKGAGVAASLTRPGTWEDPRAVVDFLFEALAKVVPTSPDIAQAWVQCAATGLISIVDLPGPASLNLRRLLSEMLPQSWMQPDTLPFVLRGIRAAGRESSMDINDPLQSVLAEMHQKFLEDHGSAAAAELLLMWVRHLDPGERQMAARIVLTNS